MTKADIIPTPGGDTPFKVAFSNRGKVFAEQGVTSRSAGQELINAILPTLQGFEYPDA